MDKLEKFIRDNRSRLDDRDPPSAVWHKIHDRLDGGKVRIVSIGNFMWRAAAVVLFAAVVWLLFERTGRTDLQLQANKETVDSQIPFEEVENFYFREIRERQNLIMKYVADHPDLDNTLMGEIDQLDSTYRELKSKAEIRNDEKILDAMILNLQMRIEILNRQIEVLEKIKNLKENETANI